MHLPLTQLTRKSLSEHWKFAGTTTVDFSGYFLSGMTFLHIKRTGYFLKEKKSLEGSFTVD